MLFHFAWGAPVFRAPIPGTKQWLPHRSELLSRSGKRAEKMPDNMTSPASAREAEVGRVDVEQQPMFTQCRVGPPGRMQWKRPSHSAGGGRSGYNLLEGI